MDKEEALHEFIKGLRIAFNNSLAYSRQHPYFLKSVEEFKLKVDILFNFLNPIKINITPESLFIDGKYLVKPLAYVELAQILHQRKIKGVEFRPGLNIDELADLLSALALSPKDIINCGGLGVLLKEATTTHILVEELDYSALLNTKSNGKPADIWRYLFKGAVEGKDVDKINEIADNFSDGLKNITLKDIATDDKLKDNLIHFLRYLKENDKEKFSKCSKELFNYLVNSKEAVLEGDILSLKVLFRDLNEKDFADILWSQVSREVHPDSLALSLFSTFSQGMNSEKIASLLSENVEARLSLRDDPILIKRIQDLISNADHQSVSPVYRNTLASLLKDLSSSEDFRFDPKGLRINYCFALLNILSQEDDQARIGLILARLDKEWSFIVENKDYEYIKYILQVINTKQKEKNEPSEALDNFKNKIYVLLEENIWDENPSTDLDYLSGLIEKSSKESQFFLNKIFQENKISLCGLRFFLRLFPAQLDAFYSGVKDKYYDLEYLNRIIEIIVNLGSDMSLVMLERIYSFSNELIKAEILKAMQGLPRFNKEFLFLILKENNKSLKKEALRVLSKDEGVRKEAVGILLGVRNLWGSRNRMILENMAVIEELGLKESVEYLIPFTKMNFFWHAPLKNKALSVLRGLR
jgi:hypothetical protein